MPTAILFLFLYCQEASGNYANMIFCVFKKENGKKKNVLVRPNMG
jgi:hypothetical protein